MSQIKVTYDELLKLRASTNAKLYCNDLEHRYELFVTMGGGLEITCDLQKDESAEVTHFEANVKSHCNAPILPQEVRFYTHDFADASTWNGKTCGDPAAPYVGGVAIHPLTGLWVDATGAGMLAAYNNPAATGYYQNPAVLYGALSYLISAQYDDVNFRWVDNLENSYKNDNANFPFTTYCWLDLSPTLLSIPEPAVWKDGSTVICYFDPEEGPDQTLNDSTVAPRGSWICTKPDTTTIDSTSNRWRVDPYDGYKIDLRAIGMSMEIDGEIVAGKSFRWKPYGMASEAQQAQLVGMGLSAEVAALPFEGPNFTYNSVKEFRYGCNDYSQTTTPEPGCASVTVTMIYDYNKTVIPSIYSSRKNRFDILIDDNFPIQKTKMARGTFIAVMWPDF